MGISGIFMAILAFSVFYEIIARYIFNSPTIWTNEISAYILQFMAFFSMGILLVEKRHVRVTFIIENLKGKARKALELFTVFLTIPYSVVLVIYGFNFTENAFRLGSKSPTLLATPLWIPYSFIMMCGILLVLAAISRMITITSENFEKEEETAGKTSENFEKGGGKLDF
jgi:TRAP-type C4-dicarboxylate transport system permease small subunit